MASDLAWAPYLVCLLLTLKIGGLATLGLIPVGTWLGWLLSRRRVVAKPLWEALLLLPMTLPPVAVGLVLLYIMAPDQPLGWWWERLTGDRLLLSAAAAVIAAFTVSLPLYVRGAREAFSSLPRGLEEAAASLGLSPWQVWLSVCLPLARPGLASAALLAFARAVGEFGATSLVAGSIAGRTETLALAIYNNINNGHEGSAWILSGVAACLAFAAVLASQLLERRTPL